MKKFVFIAALASLFLNTTVSNAKVKFEYSDKYSDQEKIVRPKIVPSNASYDEEIKNNLNAQCAAICGDGYFFDRTGAKNNGRELVCTHYPLKCGYKCTVGWNIRYLVNSTNFTCQEAQQR